MNTTSIASWLVFVRLLSSHHRLRRRHLKSLSTTCDHPARNPSPLLRDVGTTNSLQVTSERGRSGRAPPLFKGMWVGYTCSTEDSGMEEHKRGPRKWEAHNVRHETRATTFVVVHFRHPSVPSIPLTIFVPQCCRNEQIMTRTSTPPVNTSQQPKIPHAGETYDSNHTRTRRDQCRRSERRQDIGSPTSTTLIGRLDNHP